jgi:hypothetical protein
VDYSLLLIREPWDFSGCSKEEEANRADEDCESAKEEGYSIPDLSVFERV